MIIFVAQKSPELEITNYFTINNILANLTEMNAILTHIKAAQKLNAANIENLRDKAFRDLNDLSKDVHTNYNP